MTAHRDITLQSDISKMQMEPDGSFKRTPSSFRNVIEKGGAFEPEPGATDTFIYFLLSNT